MFTCTQTLTLTHAQIQTKFTQKLLEQMSEKKIITIYPVIWNIKYAHEHINMMVLCMYFMCPEQRRH